MTENFSKNIKRDNFTGRESLIMLSQYWTNAQVDNAANIILYLGAPILSQSNIAEITKK